MSFPQPPNKPAPARIPTRAGARLRAATRWRAARAGQRLNGLRRWRARSGVCPPLGAGALPRLRRALRRRLGIDLHLVGPAARITKGTMHFELDEDFKALVGAAVELSGDTMVPDEGEPALRQKQKLYNLTQLLELTQGVDGLVVECGSFRGLTAYLFCRTLAAESPDFKGQGVHLFDSFQGLSAPTPEDELAAGVPRGKTKRGPGMFSASVEVVQTTLAGFPDVTFHPGWLPESLTDAPAGPFRFVHLDLDLYDPSRGCLEFFYPRLAAGGLLVCDDYGSVRWPGVRTAVDDFCATHSLRPLRLSSGHAVLFAPPTS